MVKDSRPRAQSGQPAIGRTAFAAISAVEGLALDRDGRARVGATGSTAQRRAEVLRAYTGTKSPK